MLLGMFSGSCTVFSQDAGISQMLSAYSSDSVQLEIRKLSGEVPVQIGGVSYTIQSRLYNQPGNTYAFHYLRQKLESYGYIISTPSFSANGKNLLAIKYGSVFPEKVCMIGAHYDNLPTGSTAPGADDNASGCAAVLEAARLMKNTDFPNTVIFALWDEEELGLIGSTAYVENGVNGDPFLGYINLDMIGWDGNGDMLTEVHTRPVAGSEHLAGVVASCNEVYGIGLTLEVVNPGSVNTDHFPFWQGGYTAVGINEEYVGDTNPHYHLASDQFQYLNIPYLDANAKLSIATLSTLARFNSTSVDPAGTVSLASIFPNPVTDQLQVRFPEIIEEQMDVTVTDQRGKTVLKTTMQNSDFIELSLGDIQTGMYLLTFRGKDFSRSFSVAKL